MCSIECPNQATDKQGFTHLGAVSSWHKVECALVTALASLPDPAVVCVPHPTPLEWAVRQCATVDSVTASTVVKAWVRPCSHARACTHTHTHTCMHIVHGYVDVCTILSGWEGGFTAIR